MIVLSRACQQPAVADTRVLDPCLTQLYERYFRQRCPMPYATLVELGTPMHLGAFELHVGPPQVLDLARVKD